ncbi:MAG TPA: hypothetical protein VD884_15280 [Ohtaekwangia sp.]|nr:hypothetical protein [Ohtaekwangia sp.]
MRLNEKILGEIGVTVKKSKHELIQHILERKKNRNILSNTFCDIDYSEISLENDKINVTRRPGMLTAFRPYGSITVNIVEERGECKLLFDILPYGGNLPTLLLVGICGLIFWALLVLLINNDLFGWIFAIGTWMFAALIQYIKYQYTLTGLIDYSNRLIIDLQ